MYRFVYFTDSQADDRVMSFRNDNFGDTVLKKLEEIIDYANSIDADLFCGGDFIDRPHISYPFLVRLFRVLCRLNKDFYLVLGNHDIVGRNLESHERSAIGVLKEAGIIYVLEPMIREGFKIVPIPFTETHTRDLYTSSERSIFISHNTVVPNDVMFEHLKPSDISPVIQDRGSFVLLGHIHEPFTAVSDGVSFINPGSIGRMSRDSGESQRTPAYLDITLGNGKYEIKEYKLKSAPDYKTVFKPVDKEIIRPNGIDLSDLKGMIHSAKAQAFNISEYIKMVASKKSIPPSVVEEALSRIAESETSFQLSPGS